jgi:N-acetylmuramoyl-L-alanine amidase
MRSKILFLISVLALLAAPASASAAFGHVVVPGESLTSVAAADGLSIDQLAAANGISPGAELIAGTVLQIPPRTGAATAPAPAPASAESSQSVGESAPASTGGYVVQPGDTLSGIAAANGITVDQLAAANGLDPAGILFAGSTLSISGGESSSSAPVASSAPAAGSPQPTPETVSSSEVGQIAADHGVSPSLAEAIGYQESGFNNDLVSPTGATGVMQIEPGTWNYIQSNLGGPTLASGSATDNVRGGVLLLHSLLSQTGGDPALAAAGYYQGLASVQAHGIYADTQQYVNNVMALRQRFCGG